MQQPRLSYHVKVLREAGAIKLVETGEGSGRFAQHVYALTGKPRYTARTWSQLPLAIREIINGNNLRGCWQEVAAAAASGRMTRPNSYVGRFRLRVDAQGFDELHDIFNRAVDEMKAVEARAVERIEADGNDEECATIIGMLFETPDPAFVLKVGECS